MTICDYFRHRAAVRNQLRLISELEKSLPSVTDQDSHDQANNIYFTEIEPAYQWLSVIQTRYLQKRCAHAEVLFPEEEEYFDQMEWDHDHDESRFLTNAGFAEVKKRLREELSYRRNVVSTYATLFFGCLGMIIGLISVIKD